MSYLDQASKNNNDFDVIFLDTMKNARWSITKFIGVVAKSIWILMSSKIVSRTPVFHLNVSIGGSTYRKWFIALLCRLFSAPYVLHLHGGKYKSFFAESGEITRRMVAVLFISAEKVIVLGTVWREYVIQELRVSEQRVAIVANGTPAIACTLGDDRDAYEKVRLVFSGRISEQKGVPELLQAADLVYEDFSGFELVLMGDSRDEKLLAQVRARPYTIVTGWLTHEDVIRELASSHVFILPSHDEGLPMAMIEAMSLAVPVIVTEVGAIPDVINDGSEGYLVQPGNVEALREAIDSLVRDVALREKMGKKAYKRWHSELDSAHMSHLIHSQWHAAMGTKVSG